jgi:hypothetical protein
VEKGRAKNALRSIKIKAKQNGCNTGFWLDLLWSAGLWMGVRHFYSQKAQINGHGNCTTNCSAATLGACANPKNAIKWTPSQL